MATGCSSAASTDTGSEPEETSAAEGVAQEAPSAPETEHAPVDLEQWRKNARESASKTEDISPLDSQCADLYPDSITQQVADYIGLDVWAVSVSGLISGPSLTCEYTAEFDDWGRGSIELNSEVDSPECADLTAGREGITSDDPIEVSSSVLRTSQGCSTDGVMHRVNLMAWDDEPRAAYTADDTFGESLTALMIDDQAAYLDEALSIYDKLD